MKPIKTLHLLAIATLSLALSSCGTFNRTKSVVSTSASSSKDSSAKVSTSVDSSAATRTTLRERIDTTISIEGSKQSGSKPADNILKGDSLVLENEDQRVVVKLDPNTGNITATSQVKDRQERVQFDRELTTESATNVKREQASETAVKQEQAQSHTEEHKAAKVKAGTGWGAILAFYMAIGFILLLVVVFYGRKISSILSWFKK
jgi:hypothetical protein